MCRLMFYVLFFGFFFRVICGRLFIVSCVFILIVVVMLFFGCVLLIDYLMVRVFVMRFRVFGWFVIIFNFIVWLIGGFVFLMICIKLEILWVVVIF